MAYQIDVLKKDKIVYLRYYDDVNAKDYYTSRNVVHDIMKTQDYHRLLLCMKDAEIKSTNSEEFLFASELSDYFPYGTKIAAIVPTNNPYMDHHRFAETVCVNRLINLKIFPDFESAVTWLLE